MRGLRPLDLVILFGLGSFWIVCQVLHVGRQLDERPLGWIPIYVRAATTPDSHPTVERLWLGIDDRAGTPHPGDALLAAGPNSLAGASRLDVLAAAYAAQHGDRVPLTVRRHGQQIETLLPLRLVPAAWTQLVVALAVGVGGILVLWRGRGSRVARSFALTSFAFSLQFSALVGGSPEVTRFGVGLLIATAGLYPPLMLRTALLFPESAAPRARWPWILPWTWLITAPAAYVWLLGAPSLGLYDFGLASACFASAIAALLAILTRNYVRAQVRARRQMRWALYGFFVGTVPPMLAAAAAALRPALRPLYEASLVFQALIPFFLFRALVIDDLFDIDRLITRTMLYTLLMGAFLGSAFGVVPGLAQAASETTGFAENTLTPLLYALSGVAILGVGRLAQPWLFRWIAPESDRLARGVKRLRGELVGLPGPEALLRVFAERLSGLLRLDASALFADTGEVLSPVVLRGPAVHYPFAADGPLAAALQEAELPIRFSGRAGRGRLRGIDDADREALQAMRAELLLPIRHRTRLTAFLCLGEKSSGDIFTSQDLGLLDALAEQVSLELSRFDETEVDRGQRALSDAIAELYSCFLSYASADERFARRLYADLDARGVRTWFAPESLAIGARFRKAIDDGLARAERLVVVLSEASLRSQWVGYEVEVMRARERREQPEHPLLFPIRIDDAVLRTTLPWAVELRGGVHIGDFGAWEDESRYGAAFERLISELLSEQDARRPPSA